MTNNNIKCLISFLMHLVRYQFIEAIYNVEKILIYLFNNIYFILVLLNFKCKFLELNKFKICFKLSLDLIIFFINKYFTLDHTYYKIRFIFLLLLVLFIKI